MTRRSSRLRVRIPVVVRSLDPACNFASTSVALVVNAHGCALQTSRSLPIGTPVHIKVRDGGEGTARVVECKPFGQHSPECVVALELDNPGNIWALKSPPDDWPATAAKTAHLQPPMPAITALKSQVHLKAPAGSPPAPSANDGCPPVASAEVLEQLAANTQAIAQLKDELANSRRQGSPELEDRLSRMQQRILQLAGQQFGSRLDEFGCDYQNSIASLRAEVTAEIRTVRDAVHQQGAEAQRRTVAEAQEHFSTAVTEATRPLHQELARYRDQANESQQLHAHFASQLEKIPGMVEWHARALFDSWMDSARAELRQIVSAAENAAKAEAGVREIDREALRALLAQASSAREALEASLRELPQRVQQPITAAIEEALAGARAEISAQALRQPAPADFDPKSLPGDLRSLVHSLRAESAAAAAQLDELRSSREAVRAQLDDPGSQTLNSAQSLKEQQDAYASEIAQRVDRLAGEITERARSELEQKLLANVAERAQELVSNVHGQLEPVLKEAGDLRDQALGILNSVRTESASFESRVRGFNNEEQQLETWIAQRTSDFQKTLHDALVETTGQIKGRLQMALEMLEQPLLKRCNEANQQLHNEANRHVAEMRDQVSQLCDRLTRVQSEVEQSVREALRVQAAEATAAFTQQIGESAQRSVEQWQSCLARRLAETSKLLAVEPPDRKT